MIVMKFGGTSVANAERIRQVADICRSFSSEKPVLVASAMGSTTDNLLDAAQRALKGDVSIAAIKKLHFDAARELEIAADEIELPLDELENLLKGIALIREFSARTRDYLVSFGERLSVRFRLDDEQELVRVIAFKKKVTVVDVVSTRMLGQHGFLARVFQIFADEKVSVDMLATSEVSISMTLDHKNQSIENLKNELEKIANVNFKHGKTMVTMIGNVKRSSEILEKTFDLLKRENINVQMISQGASKVNISFIIDDDQADTCITGLHRIFFEKHN